MTERDTAALRSLLFSRYPAMEWATFLRWGWRDTGETLVVTLAGMDPPEPGDVDGRVAHVAIQEPYTLRTALAAEKHRLGVGVAHSHPKGCPPYPSPIDDDMDTYYADYLSGFAPGRPYVSLVLSEMGGELAISGRVFWKGRWGLVQRVLVKRTPLRAWVGGRRPVPDPPARNRVARLRSAFGDEAESRLRRSTAAIIGAGGTGSAAIEVFARAGVGRLIIVDPDHVDESNLERVHGSTPEDAALHRLKVEVAKRHVATIDPDCKVVALVGRLPQKEIVDAVVGADIVLGCTDQHHSRLALSDLAFRYLIPSIDCAVGLEGEAGEVTGQVLQITRLLPWDTCALCKKMTLMSPEERESRRKAAREAVERGEDPNPYWRDMPQLNTVGYLTTTAAAMASGYAIGWLTGRFDAPFETLQMNLVGKFVDVADRRDPPNPDCPCRHIVGWADQGAIDALVHPPVHWPPVRVI
ncbi:MAG: ThiF family adenylyltransferase [Planctomycetes bacterium]|nr:ThiF family adenylyltransferase [Planctomycetota bacterium]